MVVPGPIELGRGVVVADGPVPPAWHDAEEFVLDDHTVRDPSTLVQEMHRRWARREPYVVRLLTDPVGFRVPSSLDVAPWALAPDHECWDDRLHHLVWANTYDARTAEVIWWWSRKAARIGASELSDDDREGDVVVADGTACWVDGGPRATVPELASPVIPAEHVGLGSLDPARHVAEPVLDLAADQRAAVLHPSGAVRVIAPAGSGKTRVLTERVRHLLGDRGYARSTVLAVAYNKKAQEEMAERLVDVAPRTSTLNALGFALLGQHRGSRPRLLDEREVRRVIERTFPIGRRRANTDPVGPFLEALSEVRLALRDPADVEAERDDVAGLADGFDGYRRALASAGAIDFDEQIYGAIEALVADGEFRRQVQPAHAHLLVDEFQDLTPAHVLLLRLLASPTLDVFGVGDDDQTIYDHAGADPRFLIDFELLFPGAAETALEVNHRCPVAVVESADRLLQRNRVRVEKSILPGHEAPAGDDRLTVTTHAAEAGARTLVEAVKARLDAGVRPPDLAVLTRVNSLLLAPAVALGRAGVPVWAPIGPEILERTGVAAALAWLRIAEDPGAVDPADFSTVARRPSRGFPRWIDKWLGRCHSIQDVGRIAGRIDDERVASKVGDLAADLDRAADLDGPTTRRVLEFVRDEVGLGGAMSLLDGSKGGQSAASHLDDLEALLQVADLHPDLAGFDSWLHESLLGVRAPGDAVTLSTIHRVKGREWDEVVLFGMTAGLIPHRLAENVEAERRVFHVGLTHARQRVLVLGDDERPSPFLRELRTDPADDPVRSVRTEPTKAEPRRPSGAPRVEATEGRTLTVLGGYEGVVEVVEAEGARLTLEGGRSLFVRFGERIKTHGRPGVLVAPGADGDVVVRATEALRSWRLERSKGDGVPAFVVLSDAHLTGIAQRMPTDAAALRSCPGIGPTKLERYGDEILEILAAAQDGSG